MNSSEEAKFLKVLESDSAPYLRSVVYLMNIAEKHFQSGKPKHKFVFDTVRLFVKQQWGDDEWEKIEPLIDNSIDFLVVLNKHPAMLKINKHVKRCCF